ncbi:hypothetical protein ACOZ4N_17595 [Halorientalis pallida]|uniref:hypothetical protein n=1 Tax=Halorientalis pallida TaxID=2479928 RepID=UPI003C6F9ADB
MSDASSNEASTLGRLRATVDGWVAASRTGQTLTAVTDRLSVAAAESRVGSATATLGDWIRASWCYRWLTADPDPDVIVIDLRETYTVGPIIRVLDGVVDPLAESWEGSAAESTLSGIADAPVRALGIVAAVAVLTETALSLALGGFTQSGLLTRAVLFGLAAVAIQVPLSASELAETRTGRLLRAVFEPPEPPSEETERTRERPKDDEADDCD